jgi:ubiquinone/menaquinone biosynthesis C-methylase UbiE
MTQDPDEQQVSRTFDEFWKTQHDLSDMEDVGEDILGILLDRFPFPEGLRLVEVGSGSGRISLALALKGAEVTLVDTSDAALALSRSMFGKKRCSGQFVQASAFQLPFTGGTFDVAWNTGLIEHFLFDDQARILSEMLRVLKPGGTLITFNPSHRGRIYRIGKFILEHTNRWPYGREIPIRTLQAHCERIGARLEAEWDTCFDIQFYYFGKYGLPAQRWLRRHKSLNRRLSSWFGGYLKVSVLRMVGS